MRFCEQLNEYITRLDCRGKVLAVAEWLPNLPGRESAAFYQAFRQRFPLPQDDYLHLRMQLML